MQLNTSAETIWIAIGFLGQFLFFLRFFMQWLASERKKESVIPLGFWYCSIAGGFILLVYALYRKDPVFITGQSLGIFIYARNLQLIYQNKK